MADSPVDLQPARLAAAALPVSPLAVAVSLANVYRAPDAQSEVVTQVLLNRLAHPLDARPGWVHIRLSDYDGWMRAEQLATPAADATSATVAVVLAPRTALYRAADGAASTGYVYATTVLPVGEAPALSQGAARVAVGLPGGGVGWLASDAVALRPADAPFPLAGPEVALSLAQQYLGVPYLWGGGSWEGLDCSGFVQLCCRAAGRTIPRDADQQYMSMPHILARGDLSAGDLIFFARDGLITHVALMLNASRYLHAKGEPESQVVINALDPTDATCYSQHLAERYAGARRPFTDEPAAHDMAPPTESVAL